MEQTPIRIMQSAMAKTGLITIDCIGVGVGITFFSKEKKIGAGIHVLAPHSTTPSPDNPSKFANSAIPHIVKLFEKEGVSGPFAIAICGGAAMAGSPAGASMGAKIVEAVKEALTKANLRINIDETGGFNIRSMTLDLLTGQVMIK